MDLRETITRGASAGRSEDQEQVRVSLSHEELALLLGGIEVADAAQKLVSKRALGERGGRCKTGNLMRPSAFIPVALY